MCQTCNMLQRYVTLCYTTLDITSVGGVSPEWVGVCIMCTVYCPGYCVSLLSDMATSIIFVYWLL